MDKIKDKKTVSKRILALILCACVVGCILIAAGILQIAFLIADGVQLWRPDYAMLTETEMRALLGKEELSDGDYKVLYEQTGLTKIGIDRALAKGAAGVRRVLNIQQNYFKDFAVINDKFAPYVCTDRIDGAAQAIYLENGDVVVTSSTHISCYRMGHAGLVTDGESGGVLEAMAYGTPTFIGNIADFTGRITFMIFSPKTDRQTKEEVVSFAKTLVGTPYNALTGITTDKNDIKQTQCAHIVWYAYRQYGIDLDYDGGLMVTPYDLAKSPEMELVQVFGFHPETLW